MAKHFLVDTVLLYGISFKPRQSQLCSVMLNQS